MNGVGKAGGILLIISAAIGIIESLLLILFGFLFSSVDAESVGLFLAIIGVVILVISILIIVWSAGYMRDGRRKVLLGVLAIIAAVLSIGNWISLILYILAAVFVFIGKEAY